MSNTSDMQETADDLNNHPMVAAERKINEIGRAAQNTLNDGQGGTQTGLDRLPDQNPNFAIQGWSVSCAANR